MNVVSISQLKASPAKILSQAADYPVAVNKRNKIEGYLIGSKLYEKIIGFMEDLIDRQAVKKADFSKAQDFGKVAEELGI